MPQIVQFTAPRDVALVECEPQPLAPGSVRVAHLVLRHLRGHRAHRVPRHQPLPHPDLGRRARGCSAPASRPSPTPCRAGATPRWARSSRSPTTSTTSRVGDARPRHLGSPQRRRRAGCARRRAHARARPGSRCRARSPGSARSRSTPSWPPTSGSATMSRSSVRASSACSPPGCATLAGAEVIAVDGFESRLAAVAARVRGRRRGRRRPRPVERALRSAS